jgi:hypothetical protein
MLTFDGDVYYLEIKKQDKNINHLEATDSLHSDSIKGKTLLKNLQFKRIMSQIKYFC